MPRFAKITHQTLPSDCGARFAETSMGRSIDQYDFCDKLELIETWDKPDTDLILPYSADSCGTISIRTWSTSVALFEAR